MFDHLSITFASLSFSVGGGRSEGLPPSRKVLRVLLCKGDDALRSLVLRLVSIITTVLFDGVEEAGPFCYMI